MTGETLLNSLFLNTSNIGTYLILNSWCVYVEKTHKCDWDAVCQLNLVTLSQSHFFSSSIFHF